MSQDRKRINLGIGFIAVGLIGLTVYFMLPIIWGYPMWPMVHMMYRLNSPGAKELRGTVEKIEWMEIELEVDGEEIEVHGPFWFWQGIEIELGDTIVAKGAFVSMMEPGEGWHQALIPFELTIDGETYGSVDEGIPVWMQR